MTSHQDDTKTPPQKSALSQSSLSQLSSFLTPSSSLSEVMPTITANGSRTSHANGGTANNKEGTLTASTQINNKGSGSNLQIQPLSNSARKLARTKALEEADAVLAAQTFRTNRRLENFNLLGVVTSPRILDDILVTVSGSALTSSSDMQQGASSSSNGGHDPSTSSKANTSGITNAKKYEKVQSATDNSSFFNNMSTSISKEIESLNTTLYSYSKSYLGNYGGYGETPSLDFQTELGYDSARIPKGQIPVEDLPKELLEIDLTSVEAYLRKCGALAEQLNLRDIQDGDDDGDADSIVDVDVSGRIDVDLDGDIGMDLDKEAIESRLLGPVNPATKDDKDSTESVPDVFFNQYFDLTDLKTFESLLVLGDEELDESEHILGDADGSIDIDESTHDHDPIIRIQRPDKLTQHLDTIELALLNQVRSKSSSFFRETNRFSYLKSLVAESVQEVQSLRSQLDQIRERSITDAEMIPIMDRRRNDSKLLGEVLDEILDVVEVKSSVGGLIASGDYLGAVDAIHMARRLLNGESISRDSEYSNGGELSEHGNQILNKERHVLRKITAFNKINDQLSQYEDLVVSFFCRYQYIVLVVLNI